MSGRPERNTKLGLAQPFVRDVNGATIWSRCFPYNCLRSIDRDQLRVGKATNQDKFNNLPTLRSINCEFEVKAPLWYYILAEAQYEWSVHESKIETSMKLGAVGSRIVVETFVSLLLNDGHSVLVQAPACKPEIGKKMGFEMGDLIKCVLKL